MSLVSRLVASPAAGRRTLLAILAVALIARLAVIPLTGDYDPVFDSGDYDRHARSIAAGGGYPDSVFAADGGPTAFRPPLYPYLLGGLYAIVGDEAAVSAGRVLGALLGTLVVLLVYLVGRMAWGSRAGLLAAAIAAVLPPLVLLNAALITEPLFLSLALGVVAAALAARRNEDTGLRWAVLAGALCGLAALTRSNGILLVIPAAIGVWTVRPAFSRVALVRPAAVLAAAAIVVAPWVVRNTLTFDSFTTLSTQTGFGLAGAYSDDARDFPGYPASWIPPQESRRYAPLFQREDLDEAELDAELRSSARDYALDHPGLVAEAIVRNTLRTFDLMSVRPAEDDADKLQLGLSDRTADLSRVSFFVLAALGVVGFALLVRRGAGRRGPFFIWLAPLLLVLAAVWIIGSTRYRAPVYPVLSLAAAIALIDSAALVRSRGSAPTPSEPGRGD